MAAGVGVDPVELVGHRAPQVGAKARSLGLAELTGIATYTGDAVPQQLRLPLLWIEG
jgi:hypothetical protein